MSDNFFNTKNILKISLIIFPTLFWLFFLVSTKLTLDVFIIFDLISIFNSVITWNFLLFILLFPIPSIVMLAISINSEKKDCLFLFLISAFFVLLVSFFLFKINLLFLLFIFLYFLAHYILAILVQNKIKNGYKNIYELATSQLSKLALLLTVAFFLVGFLYIFPNQKNHADSLEAGIVNLFVSDNIDPWVASSYTISAQCTKTNIEHIKNTNQYKNLEKKTDPESIAFTKYLNRLYEESNENKSPEELKQLYPDLNSKEIRSKVIETIKSIPIVVILENYFAITFMFFISSFAYTYFSIIFLIYGVFVYIFNKIMEEKD